MSAVAIVFPVLLFLAASGDPVHGSVSKTKPDTAVGPTAHPRNNGHANHGKSLVPQHGNHATPVPASASHAAAHSIEQASPRPDSLVASPPRKGVLCGSLPPKRLRWKARQGPLTLAGTVVIGPGATLEIGPGTEIRIAASNACPDSGTPADRPSIALVVRGGALRVNGTAEKPVLFRPEFTGRGFAWAGIRIEEAARDDQADLRWFALPRAEQGIAFLASAGQVVHGLFEDCGIGIASLRGASPAIRHSVMARSVVADLVSGKSATRIISCLFVDGQGDGIRFDGTGLSEIRTSCFWNHRGTAIANGPRGTGGWSADSIPDAWGNWRRNPVLRGSPAHEKALAAFRQKLSTQPWWKPRRLPDDPPGSGPWALSPFSPLVDNGEGRFCSDPDGSKCDIGLWGGS